MRNLTTAGLEWDVETIKISSTEWRVRDSSRPENDPDSLCGIVIRCGDVYEAMSMHTPLVRRYFESLVNAAMFLAPHAVRVEAPQGDRPEDTPTQPITLPIY